MNRREIQDMAEANAERILALEIAAGLRPAPKKAKPKKKAPKKKKS